MEREKRGPMQEITDADRTAPREGVPKRVLVYVTYLLPGDEQTYYAMVYGKRWPTGAGSFDRLPRWREARAVAWATVRRIRYAGTLGNPETIIEDEEDAPP